MISSRISYLVNFLVWLLSKQHTWNCLGKTSMFHPKLLINFLSLSIVGQIDWHAFRIHRIDWSCVEAKQISRSFQLAACPRRVSHVFTPTRVLARLVGPTIVMAAHNNRDILMVPYEDLPDEDKDVISKAIEEFQNKCLLSKTRDNKVVHKYLLPRVLMHG